MKIVEFTGEDDSCSQTFEDFEERSPDQSIAGYDVEDGTMVVDGVARNPGIKKARRYKRLADKLKLEPMIGIEPMTYSLRVNCSTD